jgi:hypothetical protein
MTPAQGVRRLSEIRNSGGRILGLLPARPAGRYWGRVGLVVILALAFALRAASYFENPRPFAGGGLAAEQAEMARNVIDHGRWFVLNPKAYELVKKRQIDENRLVDFSHVDFSRVDREAGVEPVVDQMPGVAAVLVGLWWPTRDKTYSLIQWLQILIDTAMVCLVYWIAIRLTRRTLVALIAALLYAVWWKAISYAHMPLLDTWSVFFTIGCVAAFVWARERPTTWRRLALLGAITGVGIYFRPFVVLLPAALALAASPGKGWKRKLLWVSAPTAIALLLLAPWTIRNYYEFHRFIPTRTGLGQAVFLGSGQAASDESAKAYVQRHGKGKTYGSPGYDNTLLSSATHAIADNPVGYLRTVGRRLRFLAPCLLVLLVWRRWRRAALIPVAAAAATVVPYIFIGDDRRFYLPMFFAYFILLGMAADVVWSFAQRSRLLTGWQSVRPLGRSSRMAPSRPQAANPDGRARSQ